MRGQAALRITALHRNNRQHDCAMACARAADAARALQAAERKVAGAANGEPLHRSRRACQLRCNFDSSNTSCMLARCLPEHGQSTCARNSAAHHRAASCATHLCATNKHQPLAEACDRIKMFAGNTYLRFAHSASARNRKHGENEHSRILIACAPPRRNCCRQCIAKARIQGCSRGNLLCPPAASVLNGEEMASPAWGMQPNRNGDRVTDSKCAGVRKTRKCVSFWLNKLRAYCHATKSAL